MSNVTRILSQIRAGEAGAAAQLLPLVYEELRQLAAARLASERPGHTLQATALVHESYLRLTGDEPGDGWDSRGHFFSAAAEAMRRILIESARRKKARKHGGQYARQELDEAMIVTAEPHEDLLALDEALDRLAAVDPQAAELVKLRYFAGVTLAEAAQILGMSTRSADRLWAYARAWLQQSLTASD